MLQHTATAGKHDRRNRFSMFLPCALVAALALLPLPGIAAALWSVDKLVQENLTAVSGKPVVLPDGGMLSNIRIDYLRSLREAHKRIGEVSKVNADLALLIDPAPNAKAYFGRRMIIVTTGMLEIIGADPNMIAAVLGHEFAHLSLRHAVERAMAVPALVVGAVAVAGNVSARTRDNAAAMRAGEAAIGLMAASFSRKQEREADKVGVEMMSRARYDPEGVLKLLDIFVKRAGNKETGYLDSHPGFQERLTSAAPTVKNQQYDARAEILIEGRRWKELSVLVDQWIATNPDSAGAWYYRGLSARGLRRGGALAAFEKSVGYDANLLVARLELCVEFYRQGRERDSLICSEYIPAGELHDQYEARTFQHPVFVGGIAARPSVVAQSVQMLQDVAALKQKPPASGSAPSPDAPSAQQNTPPR